MQSDGIKVYDLTPFTLLDFPDTPAAILWLAGCNMRCPYCHNPDIVFGKNSKSFDEVVAFLERRKGLLEGIVLSGGEPTIHKDIVSICQVIKDLGYKIKLDTNGSLPKVVEELLQKKLLDCIALDFKAPKEKFIDITKSNSYENLLQTLALVVQSGIPYQIRTTVHTALLQEKDIQKIIDMLVAYNVEKYFIQNFVDLGKTLQKLPVQRKVLKQNFTSTMKIEYRNF